MKRDASLKDAASAENAQQTRKDGIDLGFITSFFSSCYIPDILLSSKHRQYSL
jgi:hypothetical protein